MIPQGTLFATRPEVIRKPKRVGLPRLSRPRARHTYAKWWYWTPAVYPRKYGPAGADNYDRNALAQSFMAEHGNGALAYWMYALTVWARNVEDWHA